MLSHSQCLVISQNHFSVHTGVQNERETTIFSREYTSYSDIVTSSMKQRTNVNDSIHALYYTLIGMLVMCIVAGLLAVIVFQIRKLWHYKCLELNAEQAHVIGTTESPNTANVSNYGEPINMYEIASESENFQENTINTQSQYSIITISSSAHQSHHNAGTCPPIQVQNNTTPQLHTF